MVVNNVTLESGIERGGRIVYADGLRGLAALWVVLFHASEGGHLSQLKQALPLLVSQAIFDFGHLGVAVFFVLSGFVMFHSVRQTEISPKVAVQTLARRFLRLCPPYWASICFVLFYAALRANLVGEIWFAPSISDIVTHLLYLQYIFESPSFSTVYWTLCLEVQFYVFFVLIVRARTWAHHRGLLGKADFILMGSTALSLPWAFGLLHTPLYPGGFLSFWYAFMLGVMLVAKDSSPTLRMGFYCFLILLVIGAWATSSSFASAALVSAAILWLGNHWKKLRSMLSAKPLQLLGVVSYSLYLTHNQITGAVAFVLKPWLSGSASTEAALLLAIIAACLLAAGIGYFTIERPSIRFSRTIKIRA